jgi:DNA-binding protein YbaB
MSSTITSITIDPKIIQAGPQRVESAVKTAVNEALAKEMEQLKSLMMDIAKDVKLQ